MVLSEISSFSVKWLMSWHMDKFIIKFVFSKTISKVDFNLAFLLRYTKCLLHVLPKRMGMVLGDGSYLFIIAGLHFRITFLKHNVLAWDDFQNAWVKTSSRLPGSCRRCCYFSTETRQPLWRTIIQYDHLLFTKRCSGLKNQTLLRSLLI